MLSAKRSKAVDWESVERHYRAGLLSVRELGKQYGVTHGAIRKRAEKEGWTRDLSAKIRAKAQAELVSTEPVSISVSTEAKRVEREIVETAAATIVQLVREHRRDISKARGITERLLGELETADLKLPGRSAVLKDLVASLRTLIPLEREAFNVDSSREEKTCDGEPMPLDAFAARIARLTGATTD